MLWWYRTHRRRRLYSRRTVYRRMKGVRGKNKRDNNRSQFLKYKDELIEVPPPLSSPHAAWEYDLSSRNGPWMQSWPVIASPLARRLVQGWAGLSQFTPKNCRAQLAGDCWGIPLFLLSWESSQKQSRLPLDILQVDVMPGTAEI